MSSRVGTMLRRKELRRQGGEQLLCCCSSELLLDPPVALRAVDHGGTPRRLQAQLGVSQLQVPLKGVHAADAEPDVALQKVKPESAVDSTPDRRSTTLAC